MIIRDQQGKFMSNNMIFHGPLSVRFEDEALGAKEILLDSWMCSSTCCRVHA